jgi:hypothetical protein
MSEKLLSVPIELVRALDLRSCYGQTTDCIFGSLWLVFLIEYLCRLVIVGFFF